MVIADCRKRWLFIVLCTGYGYGQGKPSVRFLPPPIPSPYKACLVDGCTGRTYGKAYCRKHIKLKAKSVVYTVAQRAQMRSSCCNASCMEEKSHEYGKQYCTKCKQPCCWHTDYVA